MNRKSAFIFLLIIYLVIGVAGGVLFFKTPAMQQVSNPVSGNTPVSATISAPTRTGQDRKSSEETLPTLPELPDVSDEGTDAAKPAATESTGTESAETDMTAEPEYTYTAIHHSSKLFIREDASLNAGIIGFLKPGESGDVIRVEDDWVLLKHGNVEGFVYKKYLDLKERP